MPFCGLDIVGLVDETQTMRTADMGAVSARGERERWRWVPSGVAVGGCPKYEEIRSPSSPLDARIC